MKKSLLILCLLALPVIGQSWNITHIPDGTTIFTIRLKSGEELHGAIAMNGSFITEFQKDNDTSLKNVTVVRDTPTNPGDKDISWSSIVDAQPESEQKKKKRYRDEGFEIVKGTGGTLMLVDETTHARFLRLKVLQTERDDAMAETRENIAYAKQTDPSDQTVGFVALWGGHILTIVVAGLFLFGIIRVCF